MIRQWTHPAMCLAFLFILFFVGCSSASVPVYSITTTPGDQDTASEVPPWNQSNGDTEERDLPQVGDDDTDDRVVHACGPDDSYDIMGPRCESSDDCATWCTLSDSQWTCESGSCVWKCSGDDCNQCGVGDDEKGTPPEKKIAARKIYNGVESPNLFTDMPESQQLAVVALMNNYAGSNFCTATIINHRVVLSAAHCVVSRWGGVEDPSNIFVGVGTDVSHPVAMLEVEEILVHGSYQSSGNEDHDLSLLVLKKSVWDDVEGIQPIRPNTTALTSSGGGLKDEYRGTYVQTVGFGSTQDNDNNSRKWWTKELLHGATQYGISIYGSGESSVCYGDSGGPMLYRFSDGGDIVTLGTVSWGDPSCVDYDYYARVDTDMAWVQETLDRFPEEPPDCGDLTEEIVCEGNTAKWCEDGWPRSVTGAMCVGNASVECVNGEKITRSGGWCEGDTLNWCEIGQALSHDCTLTDEVCKADENGQDACLPPTECDRLGYRGECSDDDVARWCEDGVIKKRRCIPCDQICGYVDRDHGFYCLDTEFPTK